MKIVVVDGYTINPGDLNWDAFKVLGELEVFDRSTAEEAIERLHDADIAVVNKVKINEELLSKCPNLKFIALTATGYNNIDIKSIKKHHILVANVTHYGSHAVAQHTIALLLEITNSVGLHHQSVINGDWSKINDFCFWKQPLTELYGKTFGVIGWGSIGMKAGSIAHAMGMKVIFWSRTSKSSDFAQACTTIEEVLEQSDVLSLHCYETPETQHLIREENIQKMKTGVILLNTARGGLVNEYDLKEALISGKIAAAGLDVLSEEPPKQGNILINTPNCIITPHNAWAAKETRARLMQLAFENTKAFISGNPKNLID
jgi:glycerate dehydrogenase